MENIKKDLYIFIIMIVIFPVIDILNGFFLINSISFPIGVFYRIILFFFLVLSIMNHPVQKSVYSLITFIFIGGNLIVFVFQHFLLQNPISWIVSDLSMEIKYLFWVLISYYIFQRKRIFESFDFGRFFVVINYIFTLGLLIPYFFGVGTYTYSASNAGYKGFFYAQNDLSSVFIILITFAGWQLKNNVTTKWNRNLLSSLFLFICNLYCLLIIGMKTGIIYGLIVGTVILFSVLFSKGIDTLKKRFFVWSISGMFILFIIFKGFDFFLKMIEKTYERMVYFYNLYGGDLVRLISSSRSEYLKGGLNNFLTDKNASIVYLFGQGFEYREVNFGRLGLIEMDFFDIFFATGMLGTGLFILMVGYFMWLSIQRKSYSIYSILFVVTLLYSFFAGHVFFSAVSSTMLGLIAGGIILSQKD